MAAAKDGNAVVLNEATDGVSCETVSNKGTTGNYIAGKTNQVAITDCNHNIKSGRGQVVSGSSASSIGIYVVDPWLLRLAGVPQHLYRIVDWASDVVVSRLCSPSTVSSLVNLGSEDVGNVSATVVTLMFLRLRSFSVNVGGLDWSHRIIYQYCSLLWVTSFHTSYRYVTIVF